MARRYSTALGYVLNAALVLLGIVLVTTTLLTVRYLRLSSGDASAERAHGVATVAER